MSNKTYRINEVFLSLQGEGMRAGTANVFVRFTGCNMRCSIDAHDLSPGGFDCDTEFESGRSITLDELDEWICREAGQAWSTHGKWLILTGGEPALQVDQHFVESMTERGYLLAIETNGSRELPSGLHWITVSPKVAEHCIRQQHANEVKYVRGYGQGIPRTVVAAEHKLLSPAFDGLEINKDALAWCIQLVKENPEWRLSPQQHKQWMVR